MPKGTLTLKQFLLVRLTMILEAQTIMKSFHFDAKANGLGGLSSERRSKSFPMYYDFIFEKTPSTRVLGINGLSLEGSDFEVSVSEMTASREEIDATIVIGAGVQLSSLDLVLLASNDGII